MAHVILKSGVVAAALAALTLLAPSPLIAKAHADTCSSRSDARTDRYAGAINTGFRTSYPTAWRSQLGYYEQPRPKRLRQLCRAAIRQEASFTDLWDVDFDSRGRIDQIGARRFVVFFPEVEFEGRRRDVERSVRCVVGNGAVRVVEGVPQRRR